MATNDCSTCAYFDGRCACPRPVICYNYSNWEPRDE